MPNTTPNPLVAPDRSDPGDETLRRYRYQATYAATLAVEMLHADSDVVEIYCEQYEDILIRLSSGKFRGIQIKTREETGGPLRATDESILDALLGFVSLELAFPDTFVGFMLGTNSSFDRDGKGHGNLPAVLGEMRAWKVDPTSPCTKARRLAATLIKRLTKQVKKAKRAKGVAASNASPSVDDVLRVLLKLDAVDDLPKLPDIKGRLRSQLAHHSSKAANSTLAAVDRVVDALEHVAYSAASRADEDGNGRLWFVADPEKRALARTTAELQGKCITREIVSRSIDKHCSGSLVVSATPANPDQVRGKLSILDRKLVAGGLSAGTISMAHDAVASVEELGTRWLYQDAAEGLRRYNHARTVVKKECTIAYEARAAEDSVGTTFGPQMLSDIESRLKQRRILDESGVLKECDEEHLLGHAFALTGDCIVWWSTSRDLGNQENEEEADSTPAGETKRADE